MWTATLLPTFQQPYFEPTAASEPSSKTTPQQVHCSHPTRMWSVFVGYCRICLSKIGLQLMCPANTWYSWSLMTLGYPWPMLDPKVPPNCTLVSSRGEQFHLKHIAHLHPDWKNFTLEAALSHLSLFASIQFLLNLSEPAWLSQGASKTLESTCGLVTTMQCPLLACHLPHPTCLLQRHLLLPTESWEFVALHVCIEVSGLIQNLVTDLSPCQWLNWT